MTYCFLRSSPNVRYHDAESSRCGHFLPLHYQGTVIRKLQMPRLETTSGRLSLPRLPLSSPFNLLSCRYVIGWDGRQLGDISTRKRLKGCMSDEEDKENKGSSGKDTRSLVVSNLRICSLYLDDKVVEIGRAHV